MRGTALLSPTESRWLLVGDVTDTGQCAVRGFDRNYRAVLRGEEGAV